MRYGAAAVTQAQLLAGKLCCMSGRLRKLRQIVSTMDVLQRLGLRRIRA